MALETYINNEVQAFLKFGAASLLLSLQQSPVSNLLKIYNAYAGIVTDEPTLVELVQINPVGSLNAETLLRTFAEVERVTLPASIIKYDLDSNQYIINIGVAIGFNMEQVIYFIEFTNGTDIFKTECFLPNISIPGQGQGVGLDIIGLTAIG